MQLSEYRVSQKLSQEKFGRKVGKAAKSYISGLEGGKLKAPLRMALEIHRESGGAVPVESLVTDKDAELLAFFAKTSAQKALA